MMQEELNKKQKLIDDQTSVIKNLKEKIEIIEEQNTRTKLELEERLNEKEKALQIKIATFEANLHEGRQYFEEILNEKEVLLKEKFEEIERLKRLLSDSRIERTDSEENEASESVDSNIGVTIADTSLTSPPELSSSMLLSTSASNAAQIQRIDADSIKSIKSLYEHQFELLKVKIEMLEKTCANYQQGIKEMNKIFGYQQQSDEMASMQIFKDIMQQLQKSNALLETDKIDLQVKLSKLKEEADNYKVEKENLARKYANVEAHNGRLVVERAEMELSHRNQMNEKQTLLTQMESELGQLNVHIKLLSSENHDLKQTEMEYHALLESNKQLQYHYEQLYTQAGEIVAGNQMLNEQQQANVARISELEQLVADFRFKLDHLEQTNSTLNTEKVNMEMKCAELEELIASYKSDMMELNVLRMKRLNSDKLSGNLKELEQELIEKNELIEQLNKAKEFLAENNSKLLTNNIKLQLLLESVGVDEAKMIEASASLREYEELRAQNSELKMQLSEIKILNNQLEFNCSAAEKLLKKERNDFILQIIDKDQEINQLKNEILKMLEAEKISKEVATPKETAQIKTEETQVENRKQKRNKKKLIKKSIDALENQENSRDEKENSELNEENAKVIF
jgi:hypothetical protein